MYRICPKCGHQRSDHAPMDTCPACGLLFRKWLKQRYAAASTPVPSRGRARGFISRPLQPAADGRAAWLGRGAVWLLLLWLGWLTLATGYEDVVGGSTGAGYNFMHRIDLVFHEAGHVLFRPFGSFMTVLGGSLLQVLVPAAVTGAFLVQANNFGASVGLWWTGQSLADVAIYARDARELRLPLLGGGTGADRPGFHDWHTLLGQFDGLGSAPLMAGLMATVGTVCMAAALLWGAELLRRQWRSANR